MTCFCWSLPVKPRKKIEALSFVDFLPTKDNFLALAPALRQIHS